MNPNCFADRPYCRKQTAHNHEREGSALKLTAYRAADPCIVSVGLNQYRVHRKDFQGGSFVVTIGAYVKVGPFVLALQWGRP